VIVRLALYPVLVLYLISTFCYMSALVGEKRGLERWGYHALLLGFGFHVLALLLRYVGAGATPAANLHETLSFLRSASPASSSFSNGLTGSACSGPSFFPFSP